MNEADCILKAREERAQIILRLAAESDVVTVKANVPGENKRIGESFLLVRHFTALALEKFGGKVLTIDGADGLCSVIYGAGRCSKDTAVWLERQSAAGRLIDIDVWQKGGESSVSRGHMRRCFVCGDPAFVCARSAKHSPQELISAFKAGAREYFSELLACAVKSSLMTELNLEDKFGLVTPTSSGSHTDMDYALMVKSQTAIIPYLVDAFWAGFDNKAGDKLLEKLRPIGKEAERTMLAANGGVNAYKGLIFEFGILLAAAGASLSSGSGDYGEIFAKVKHMCGGITDELKDGTTFGAEAYRLYRITGARGHAESGFAAAREAERIIDKNYSAQSLLRALCRIVGIIDDTVLLKRCKSYERYLCYKRKISRLDIKDTKRLKILNGECIKNGLSIGGSADVLAAGVLLKKFRSIWYFDK